jgi:hypothetical protein
MLRRSQTRGACKLGAIYVEPATRFAPTLEAKRTLSLPAEVPLLDPYRMAQICHRRGMDQSFRLS